MAAIDLRKCLNAISDVITNRPMPLREFDQIYMKAADMLLQVDHVSKKVSNRSCVFVGDGDAIGLCLVHLHSLQLIDDGPSEVLVLDFDERIVNGINTFASNFGISKNIRAELYNVSDPVPEKYWETFNGFYTNPPFGASNKGKSIEVFLRRANELICPGAIGCLVLADHPQYQWTQEVLAVTQSFLINNHFIISEMVPEFHHYHLDDAPDLTSCSIIVKKSFTPNSPYTSLPLSVEELQDFYGEQIPLRVQYVKDKTGGKYPSKDYELIPIKYKSK